MFNDLTGQTFHRLMALYRMPNRGNQTQWCALCDCGKLIEVRAQHLRNGNTKSCGCWDRDVLIARSTKHGGCGTGAYRSWVAMMQRCNNRANKEWHNYGGRGIKVCDRWREAKNFLADMGERPDGLTLERREVNGNYEPSNCYWATRKEQGQNRRDSAKNRKNK